MPSTVVNENFMFNIRTWQITSEASLPLRRMLENVNMQQVIKSLGGEKYFKVRNSIGREKISIQILKCSTATLYIA